MTENLAGRGEGLAGLVAQIKKWRDDAEIGKKKLSGAGMALSPTRNEMVGYIRACDDMLEVLAALEAAARLPAAPDVHFAIKAQCFRCRESYPCRWDKNDYIPNFGEVHEGDWTHPETLEFENRHCDAAEIHEALRAALATPSPQAPQCCCNASWLDLDRRDCPVHGPTTTQEQPTGSADSRSVQRRVALQKGYSMPEFSSDPGSPRKVGEDGALAARCNWINDITFMHSPKEARRIEAPCLQDGYAAIFENGIATHVRCKFHFEGMLYRNEDVSKYRPLSLLRPSSAPVGEQK